MKMNRRKFMRNSILASSSLLVCGTTLASKETETQDRDESPCLWKQTGYGTFVAEYKGTKVEVWAVNRVQPGNVFVVDGIMSLLDLENKGFDIVPIWYYTRNRRNGREGYWTSTKGFDSAEKAMAFVADCLFHDRWLLKEYYDVGMEIATKVLK